MSGGQDEGDCAGMVDRGGGVKKKGNGRDGWGANNGGVGGGEWGEQLERVG